MIPRLLHFVWMDDSPGRPGPLSAACRARAAEAHPAWEAADWSGPSVLDHPALSAVRPLLREAWEKFGRAARGGHPKGWSASLMARTNLVRLCALYALGGVCLDHDVWVVRPLDEFLSADLLLACNSFAPFVVGEHVIGCEPGSPKMLAVVKHFCRVEPHPRNGAYCPQLARFVYEFGWEAQLPDVFCPHPRDAGPGDLYRVTPVTHAIHCWSPLGYDVDRLREATENAPPAPAPRDVRRLEIEVA